MGELMMRHWNLTYNDPDRWREVYAVAGRPLGFSQTLINGFRGRPTGSPRAQLVGASRPEIQDLLTLTDNLKWANIQRTQNGVILYFRVLLETYGIPFKSEGLTVSEGPDFRLMHGEDWLAFQGQEAPNLRQWLLAVGGAATA